jgi:hypothetical protein
MPSVSFTAAIVHFVYKSTFKLSLTLVEEHCDEKPSFVGGATGINAALSSI